MDRQIHTSIRVTACVLIGLVTMEMSARIEDWLRYRAPLLENYSADSLYQMDKLGKTGKPHARYMKWQLNEAGFRGPALRRGTYRILCLGSSETFGQYESEGREWPRELERMLQSQTEAPIEVVNGAYPGLTIATNNRRLGQTLGLVQPRVVVIYPSFTSYIALSRITAAPVVRFRKEPLEFRLRGRLETLIKNALPESIQDDLRKLEIRFTDQNEIPAPRIPQANVDRFESDLDNLVAGIQQSGAAAVLVTHATRFGAAVRPEEQRYLVAWRKFFPMLQEGGFLDMEKRMNQAVADVAQRHGVKLVDAAARLEPGPRNFVEFVHFTNEGAHSLAALVAEDVRPMIAGAGDSMVRRAGIVKEQEGLSPQ